MKKILFPVDLSPTGKHAFCYAIRIASLLDACLIILHIYDFPDVTDPSLPDNVEDILNLTEREARRRTDRNIHILGEIVREVGRSNPMVSNEIRHGERVSVIATHAEEKDVDLIVIGVEKESKLKLLLMGSVITKLIKSVTVPVLSVPMTASTEVDMRKIAYTTLFKSEEIPALQSVVALAKAADASVYAVYITPKQTEKKQTRLRAFKRHFHRAQVNFEIVQDKHPGRCIENYVKAHEIDVVAVLTYRRNSIARLLRYSLAQKLSHKLQIPLCALHLEED